MKILINQKKYSLNLLTEVENLNCKPSKTPIMVNYSDLQIVEGAKLTDLGRYQTLVRKLIYMSHTRPNIAYVIGVVSISKNLAQYDRTKHVEIRLTKFS